MSTLTARQLPILFSPDLAQKVHLGIKTETRRLLDPQPSDLPPGVYCDPYNGNLEHFTFWTANDSMCNGVEGNVRGTCHWKPKYLPGDLLYVREAHAIVPERGFPYLKYRGKGEIPGVKWKPSIHLPKLCSRAWLEVLSVSVERVQEIDEICARAEGYRQHTQPCGQLVGQNPSAVQQFASSWDRRYPGSWDRNEWVFVFKFKKLGAPK
jgi:hypothetical protein